LFAVSRFDAQSTDPPIGARATSPAEAGCLSEPSAACARPHVSRICDPVKQHAALFGQIGLRIPARGAGYAFGYVDDLKIGAYNAASHIRARIPISVV
jgi:hypothetical protein